MIYKFWYQFGLIGFKSNWFLINMNVLYYRHRNCKFNMVLEKFWFWTVFVLHYLCGCCWSTAFQFSFSIYHFLVCIQTFCQYSSMSLSTAIISDDLSSNQPHRWDLRIKTGQPPTATARALTRHICLKQIQDPLHASGCLSGRSSVTGIASHHWFPIWSPFLVSGYRYLGKSLNSPFSLYFGRIFSLLFKHPLVWFNFCLACLLFSLMDSIMMTSLPIDNHSGGGSFLPNGDLCWVWLTISQMVTYVGYDSQYPGQA